MIEQALREAGFTGVETVDGVVFARSNPALPEFTARAVDGAWHLSQAWPLRASDRQIAAWNALYPQVPMDIHHGETRITLWATAETLPLWAEMTEKMVAQCVAWRRATRQRDEGM